MPVPVTGAERKQFYFQFITTPSPDTPGTTLLLHFDNRRYLFGQVAEGTQRALNERGISLKKSRSIFLTGETRWKYNSGLLGMILTMADYQSDETVEEKASQGMIRIYGGPKLWHTIACARRFIFRTGMPLRVQETDPTSWSPETAIEYADDNISVWSLPASPPKGRRLSESLPNVRSSSPDSLGREQSLRAQTVHDMFDSDWKKDRLVEAVFSEVSLPAMVWVRDPESKDLQATFCTKMADAPHIEPDQKVFVRMPWPAALVTELPAADNLAPSIAMSYIVKSHPQRGQFEPEKAKALGLKPGPDYGKLAKGEVVTLPDGRTIRPEDVVGPMEPGKGAAILDVPSESYLADLSDKLNQLQLTERVLDGVDVFVWMLGDYIAQSEEFVALKARYPQMRHVISSQDTSPLNLTMDSAAASAARLQLIRPSCFLAPRYDNTEPMHNKSIFDQYTVQAQRMLRLSFTPKFEANRDEVPVNLNTHNPTQWTKPTVQQLVPPAQSSNGTQPGPYDGVYITTLGTGSAMPSKYRNVSANLLFIPAVGYFLFDAGENTLGQLRRAFSPRHLEEILCRLHMIWISHLHADHHLGTISLLIACKEARKRHAQRNSAQHISPNLYLISEPNMADFLQDYSSVENTGCVMLRCLNSSLTDLEGRPISLDQTTLPIRKLATTRVSHCHGAQGVAVTFENGFKLSYSGDCRPSATFAQIGRDSDVLIHEATFDDGMEGDARAKKHSTIGEALGVASAMRAKNVILTHFSQRYQKLPTLKHIKFADQIQFEEGDDSTDLDGPLEDVEYSPFTESQVAAVDASERRSSSRPRTPTLRREATSLAEAAEKMAICVAFDLMKVTIPQIKDMYKYYPAIEHMFELESQFSQSRKVENRKVNDEILKKQEELAAARRAKHRAPQKDSKRQKRKARSENGTVPLTSMRKSRSRESSPSFDKGHRKKKSKSTTLSHVAD